ncbi:hypothetical protein TTHERM_00329870 (macronuclear) [Tetrahymena thermophila SB210]|uniref:Uncharacterized protein n=1 Tax=Tetrahymena thermophila (strain SB210) TaxID=312017 RepID=I7MJJ2_TETTS|nr:hypothetical protein TTHERM_00329870 [Tetrahymena thermophila SB210]EAS06307.2 hypothetical protein TTHERM_00329870 [Tetrahymena thermophila SB210]|eukprot:XP_001026552.2 hypothetical protein TTHERM_00329870 [Tetrahymena thermophila SB210]
MSALKAKNIIQEITPIKTKFEIIQQSAPEDSKRIFRVKRAVSTQKIPKQLQNSFYLLDQQFVESANENQYSTERTASKRQISVTDFQSLVQNGVSSQNSEGRLRTSPKRSIQKIVLKKKRAFTLDGNKNIYSQIDKDESQIQEQSKKMPHLRSTSAFDKKNTAFQKYLKNMQIIEDAENKKNALPLTSEQQFQEEMKKFQFFLNSERLVQDKNIYEEYETLGLNEKLKIESCAGMNKLVKLKVRGSKFPIRFTVYTNGGYYTIYFKDSYPSTELCNHNCDYEINQQQKFINLYDKRSSNKEIKYIFCNITFQTYCFIEINAIETAQIKSVYSASNNILEALKKFKQEKLKKEKKVMNSEEYHDFMMEIEAIKLRRKLKFQKMFPNALDHMKLNKKDLDMFRWKKDEILEKNREVRLQRTEQAIEKKDILFEERQQFREQWLLKNDMKRIQRIKEHKQYILSEWIKLINFLNFVTIIKNAHITAKIVRIFSKSMENKIHKFLKQGFQNFQQISVQERHKINAKMSLIMFTKSIKKKVKAKAGLFIKKVLTQVNQQNTLKQKILQTIQKVTMIQTFLRNYMFVPRQFILKKLWDEIINELTFTDKRRKNVLGEFISDNINPFTLDKYIHFYEIKEPKKCTYTQLVNQIDEDLKIKLLKEFRKMVSQMIVKSQNAQTEEKDDTTELKNKSKAKSQIKVKRRKKAKTITRKRELTQIEESPQTQSGHFNNQLNNKNRSNSKIIDEIKGQDSITCKKSNSNNFNNVNNNKQNNNNALNEINEQMSTSSISIQETPNMQSIIQQDQSQLEDFFLNIRKQSSSSVQLNIQQQQQQEDFQQKALEIQRFNRKFIQPQTYQEKKKLEYNMITFSGFCKKLKYSLLQKIFKEMERIRVENKWEL